MQTKPLEYYSPALTQSALDDALDWLRDPDGQMQGLVWPVLLRGIMMQKAVEAGIHDAARSTNAGYARLALAIATCRLMLLDDQEKIDQDEPEILREYLRAFAWTVANEALVTAHYNHA